MGRQMETFTMDQERLKELAKEFAKGIKTQHDLNDFSKMLTKLTVETALNAELTEHLGYEKHQNSPEGTQNARNGTTKKKLKGSHGEIVIESGKAVLCPNYSLSSKVV